MGNTIDKSSLLFRYQDKSAWLGVSKERYRTIAEEIIILKKKQPEAVTEFLKNVSAFDYVKLSEAHKDFMSETLFSLDKETQNNYIKALDTSKHGTYNIFARILNFISINFIHFSQTAFAKKSNLLDPSGECMGLTGTWLVTDKFHNNLRQEVNSGVDYSDMPMVRQIAFLQRNQEVKSRHNEAFDKKSKPYTEEKKSEIAQSIVKDIVENPEKDRIQFFMRCKEEKTGHTTGMRITHMEGGQFKLTYYDPNFGEKRSGAFTNDADGQLKAAQFVENALNFTETLSMKTNNVVDVSYNINSRADLKKDFDRDANPGPTQCKEHEQAIKNQLLSMKRDIKESQKPEARDEASNSASPHA
ncbi:hypothetical protein Lmor_1175 [Legionella moravica]|uniref:Cysteine protease domain, YopT-type n=1 Tax=Legionella moravica TaxID=39962 RepID=A0A378JV18_9GAMM|nr:hypothetical protein [Legionella moravica]KTD34642.1 hypothetical protein Lmor_1175 [Legionella moravica]STX61248.1 cysteine protease domain, YopT-type [Legionella moravica]